MLDATVRACWREKSARRTLRSRSQTRRRWQIGSLENTSSNCVSVNRLSAPFFQPGCHFGFILALSKDCTVLCRSPPLFSSLGYFRCVWRIIRGRDNLNMTRSGVSLTFTGDVRWRLPLTRRWILALPCWPHRNTLLLWEAPPKGVCYHGTNTRLSIIICLVLQFASGRRK